MYVVSVIMDDDDDRLTRNPAAMAAQHKIYHVAERRGTTLSDI